MAEQAGATPTRAISKLRVDRLFTEGPAAQDLAAREEQEVSQGASMRMKSVLFAKSFWAQDTKP